MSMHDIMEAERGRLREQIADLTQVTSASYFDWTWVEQLLAALLGAFRKLLGLPQWPEELMDYRTALPLQPSAN